LFQQIGAHRHCEEQRDEAIHNDLFCGFGLLRGACHRACVRATHWLCLPYDPEAECSKRQAVMPGPVAGIHVLTAHQEERKMWMAGSSPAMMK